MAKSTMIRGKLRFKPDLNTIAVVECGKKNEKHMGLVIDESHTGCRVAFLTQTPIKNKDDVVIAVGQLAPMMATVIWRKEQGPALCEVGFEFNE